jgi:hypothetical protein
LAVHGKLRACDLIQLRVRDVRHGQNMASRALILQQKTQRPVEFEITEPTRDAVSAWIKKSALNPEDFLVLGRIHESPHLSTRQYARIVDSWVQLLGLDTMSYGTHTLRLTKAALIYIDGPRTCEPYSCYSVIPSSRVQFGTSESKWMTRLKWRSKLTCKHTAPVGDRGRRPATTGHTHARKARREAASHGMR